jgi:hypothetical protein
MMGAMDHVVATVTAIRFALFGRCDVLVDLATGHQNVAVRLPGAETY